MDPQLPQVPLPEQQPILPNQVELGGVAVPQPEVGRGSMENSPAVSQNPLPISSLPQSPIADMAIPGQPYTPPGLPTIVGPAIADDVDVIEKEWVDKADRIVEVTSQDPYVEEEAIEDLQVDYLKKRYGKEIKKDQIEPHNGLGTS